MLIYYCIPCEELKGVYQYNQSFWFDKVKINNVIWNSRRLCQITNVAKINQTIKQLCAIWLILYSQKLFKNVFINHWKCGQCMLIWRKVWEHLRLVLQWLSWFSTTANVRAESIFLDHFILKLRLVKRLSAHISNKNDRKMSICGNFYASENRLYKWFISIVHSPSILYWSWN